LEARLGNRRAPAVALMTLGMLLLLVIPLWTAIATIAEHADAMGGLAKKVAESGLPQPPEWVAKVPLVGKRLSATMSSWADAGPAGLEASLGPYVSDAARWALHQAGGLGGTMVQFLLVVVLSAIMYSGGESAARAVRRFGRRLAGQRGEESVILAGKAIRSVALGVGVTAVVQTVLGGIGLAVAGVPYTSLLSAVMLMLCIAQLGPALVLFPAVAWMYWTGASGWGTFLLVWSLVVSSLDNILRPMLIKRGDRRTDQLWPDRDLRRTRGLGGDLHAARSLDRGRSWYRSRAVTRPAWEERAGGTHASRGHLEFVARRGELVDTRAPTGHRRPAPWAAAVAPKARVQR
jgi:predicted PurR-regulated permease PerM